MCDSVFIYFSCAQSFTGSIFPLDLLNRDIKKFEAISPFPPHSSPKINWVKCRNNRVVSLAYPSLELGFLLWHRPISL